MRKVLIVLLMNFSYLNKKRNLNKTKEVFNAKSMSFV